MNATIHGGQPDHPRRRLRRPGPARRSPSRTGGVEHLEFPGASHQRRGPRGHSTRVPTRWRSSCSAGAWTCPPTAAPGRQWGRARRCSTASHPPCTCPAERLSRSTRLRRASLPPPGRRRTPISLPGSSRRTRAPSKSAGPTTRRARSTASSRPASPASGWSSSRSTPPAATGRATRRTSTTCTGPLRTGASWKPTWTRSTTTSIDRPEGYALQRVYTDADSPLHRAGLPIDAAVVARNNDVVLIPEGLSPGLQPGRLHHLLPQRAGRQRPEPGLQRRPAATPGSKTPIGPVTRGCRLRSAALTDGAEHHEPNNRHTPPDHGAGARSLFSRSSTSNATVSRPRSSPAASASSATASSAGVGQALQQMPDFRYYQVRNEQAVVHAATAYAKVKNRLQTLRLHCRRSGRARPT